MRDVLCHVVLPPFVPKDGCYVPTAEGMEEVEETLGKAACLYPQNPMKSQGPGGAVVITSSWPVPLHPQSLDRCWISCKSWRSGNRS